MSAPNESGDNEYDSEMNNLQVKISELRTAKKELFERARPINEELERIRRLEQQHVDELRRLRTNEHDNKNHRQAIIRLSELESELKRAKSENEKLLDTNRKLKQSLNQGTKYSKIQNQKIAELERQLHSAKAAVPARFEIIVHRNTVRELREQLDQKTELLNRAKKELNETRHRLSDVHDRLIVSEQVTQATQQRALQESVDSEELQRELRPQHRPATHTAGSDVLRALYPELTTMLDARIVAPNMYQRNALTLKELQLIQSLRDRPVEAAEKLLDIIIVEQPDAVYLCFLDVLKRTEQQHIYQRLVEDGYRDYDSRSLQTSIIRQHYVFLLETLDVKFSGLVSQLYADQVISAVEKDDIGVEKTSFRANERLLSVLSRKSSQQFQLFLDALDNRGQRHIRNKITHRQERVVEVRQTSQVAAASQTDEDVTVTEQLFHISLSEMIHQFFVHTIDINRGNLIGKLATNGILSLGERQNIKIQKTVSAKANSLVMTLREKSPAQFESFLTTLGETGQQSVVSVVRQALFTVGQSGHNPLQSLCVGPVVHTLPEGELVVGVTSLAGEIYVLRPKERDQIEVYDVVTYRLLHCLTVPDCRFFTDMTSCEHYRCIYVANHVAECVHRVDVGLQGDYATQWAVNDKPNGLSVNRAHNVLVTCRNVRKIKEFSSHGEVLHKVTFPDDVTNPWHAVQLKSGQFIVCHSDLDNSVHHVSVISADGRLIVHSHGGQRGSETDQFGKPRHLAVDSNEFVFVADFDNRRVTMLSPALNRVHQILSRDELKGGPDRLCLDVQRRRLLVADNESKDGRKKGRVVVFSV